MANFTRAGMINILHGLGLRLLALGHHTPFMVWHVNQFLKLRISYAFQNVVFVLYYCVQYFFYRLLFCWTVINLRSYTNSLYWIELREFYFGLNSAYVSWPEWLNKIQWMKVKALVLSACMCFLAGHLTHIVSPVLYLIFFFIEYLLVHFRAYHASLVEPWLIFWQDTVKSKYLCRFAISGQILHMILQDVMTVDMVILIG